MPATSFLPRLNGADRASFPPLAGCGVRALAWELRRARQEVLAELRQSYLGGVDIYRLEHHVARWSEAAVSEADVLGQAAGELYLTLDYFQAGLFLPRSDRRIYTASSTQLAAYFWQRSADNLAANTAGLLSALAISTLIPDDWLPVEALVRRIQVQADRLRVFDKIKLACELGLPAAGIGWMNLKTQAALGMIQTKLAQGEVCLARLIQHPSRLSANRQVIVYDYAHLPGERLQLSVYEPGCICRAHMLDVALSAERPVLLETCLPAAPTPVFGILADQYLPASLPETAIPGWLRSRVIRRWYWRMRHWLARAG